jgi:hypothetical protein
MDTVTDIPLANEEPGVDAPEGERRPAGKARSWSEGHERYFGFTEDHLRRGLRDNFSYAEPVGPPPLEPKKAITSSADPKPGG